MSAEPQGGRALLTGEGLKETFLCDGGLPGSWPWHRQRMRRGAQQMGLPWPGDAALEGALMSGLRDHVASSGPLDIDERLRVRLLLLAAGSTRDLGHVEATDIVLFMEKVALAELRQDPARLALGPRLRNANHPLAGCKTTAIAADLVALRAARAAGFDDVLLRDQQGRFAEASTSNILFGLSDGKVLTPAPECGAVAGTVVARLMAAGPPRTPALAWCRYKEAHLSGVRWAVLVNAVRGARAVSAIGDHRLDAPPADWSTAIQRRVWMMEPADPLDPGDGRGRQ